MRCLVRVLNLPFTAKRRSPAAAGVFAAFVLAGLSATAPAQSVPHGAGLYTISGALVNSITGEAIANAQVALLAESDSHLVASTKSGADGRFELPNLPAAKYQLSASKRGFHTAFFDEHDMFNSAVVTGPGQDTGHLVFRLPPSASLHGVITDDGGDPVEDARVMLFEFPSEYGPGPSYPGAFSTGVTHIESATTDDTGAYEFSNLVTGKYALAVVAQPWFAVHSSASGEANSALDVAYPITFYDSTTDEASTTPIALTPGAREEANFALHAVPALHLAVATPRNGRDKNIDIAPAASLQQSLFGMQIPVETPALPSAHNPGVSEFSGLAPGHYELTQGSPPRIVEIDAASSQQIDAAEGAPTTSVAVTLLGASESAPPGSIALALYPAEGNHRSTPILTAALQGRFRFDAVLPGKWELRMWNSGVESAVTSITQNGKRHAGNGLAVGDLPLTISASVNEGNARVRGFVRKNGKGLAGAMVLLVPKDPLAFPALLRRDQSDSDGSFSLNGVAPGAYTVVAIEDGWNPNPPFDWLNAKELARFLPKGAAASVTGGGTVQLPAPVLAQNK